MRGGRNTAGLARPQAPRPASSPSHRAQHAPPHAAHQEPADVLLASSLLQQTTSNPNTHHIQVHGGGAIGRGIGRGRGGRGGGGGERGVGLYPSLPSHLNVQQGQHARGAPMRMRDQPYDRRGEPDPTHESAHDTRAETKLALLIQHTKTAIGQLTPCPWHFIGQLIPCPWHVSSISLVN